MSKRHFLVQEINQEYVLREIDAAVAHGMEQFGVPTGQHWILESVCCIFYFMNTRITPESIEELVPHLAQRIFDNAS